MLLLHDMKEFHQAGCVLALGTFDGVHRGHKTLLLRTVELAKKAGLPSAALTFDLANLEYISSAGLRVILKTQKEMSRKGGMRLIHVPETVMEVFDITGFVDFLTIEN